MLTPSSRTSQLAIVVRRLKTHICFSLGFSAQLMALWLALAPGLVLCMERDGEFAVEASISGDVCGTGSTSAQPPGGGLAFTASIVDHCDGCNDVPLYVSGGNAAEHQHITIASPVAVASVPSTIAFAVITNESTSAHLICALQIHVPSESASGPTVLRI